MKADLKFAQKKDGSICKKKNILTFHKVKKENNDILLFNTFPIYIRILAELTIQV